jgi:predicted DNA-binding protein with PD1-like motif
MPRSGKDLMSGLRELTQDSDLTAGSLTATGTIAAGAIERAVLGFLEKYNPI